MASAGQSYLDVGKGIGSWLTTLDHKKIGIMYMISIMIFFALGGFFALAMRLELFKVGETLMSAQVYNEFMTAHGAIMVFMVIIPGIPAIFGNFFLPLHLGAKDVAFPRLNLASWYMLMTGAAMAVATIFMKSPDTGWTFYTPYSIDTDGSVTLMVLAAFIMGMSSVFTGLNFMATVHKMRCKGMSLMRMPLFVWAIYSTAIIQVLATPVLGITLLLLALERILGIGFFDPTLGGDPVLFQHFFWFYSHPAVYIMILPAMGVMSEVIVTFSQKTIFGYKAIVYSSFGIAAVSFLVWGHHMFVSGQSEVAGIVFSFLTMFVGVPTAVKLFNWVATMYRGNIQMLTPMLYALGFMFIFTIGGVTGIMLATMALDVHFHDTYFVVAHFHYVMVGGTLMAIMAAFYYWLPKMFGRIYNEALAQVGFFFVFLGFNVTFFPQFILGSMGMPRRYFDYLPAYEPLNQVSTVGSWMIGLGFVIGLATIIQCVFKGKKATSNPWGGKTLEWTIPSPPTEHNFETLPTVTAGPYEYR